MIVKGGTVSRCLQDSWSLMSDVSLDVQGMMVGIPSRPTSSRSVSKYVGTHYS